MLGISVHILYAFNLMDTYSYQSQMMNVILNKLINVQDELTCSH